MVAAARRAHRATLAWAALTAVLLLLPGAAVEESEPDWLARLLDRIPGVDKLVHALLFLILAVLLCRSLRLAGTRWPAAAAVTTSIAYGLLLELAQLPVPGRSAEVLDAVSDAAGAVLGAILCRIEPIEGPGRFRSGPSRR